MTTTVATTSTAAGPNIGKTTQKQFSIFYLILTKYKLYCDQNVKISYNLGVIKKTFRLDIEDKLLVTLDNPNCNGGNQQQVKQCCPTKNPCAEGKGDCDSDAQCLGNLVCGTDNCDSTIFSSKNTDCCEKGTQIFLYPH